MADLTSVYADRASFGLADTAVPSGPLRLGALAAAAAGAARLALDASGNVTAGVLTAADIPPAFVRRDVAETINASWTWAAGTTISFAAGGSLAAPAATSRSAGTRLVLEPVSASTEYAQGRESGALWTSVPALAAHKWYQGASERLRLDTDGTLKVIGGSGALLLQSAATGDGAIAAALSLALTAAGVISLSTNGGILPALGYRENLGLINRKYLQLHCAELWAETLVAQDTLATIGGRVLVGQTTTLTRDCAPGDTTVYVKHNAFSLHVGLVEYGSKLVLQSGGKFEVLEVTATAAPAAEPAGDYGYTVNRNFDGSGANQWYAGDAVFDTGKFTTGPGAFIDLYSINGLSAGTTAGPTIVGNVRINETATGWRERWAIGNLAGIYNNSAAMFGAAFGDPAGIHLQIDATNGIRMLGGGNTATYGQWDMAGNLSLGYTTSGQIVFTAMDGSLRMKVAGVDKMALLNDGALYLSTGLICGAFAGTTGVVRSFNALDWNSGSGFYFRYTQATNQTAALIGNSAGRRVQWDGASLKVISDGFILDENGITMGQHAGGSPTENGKTIKFGVSGALMWDTATGGGRFEILRGGQIRIEAGTSGGLGIELQAGGSGIDRVILQLVSVSSGQSQMILGGQSSGGVTYPRFVPSTDTLQDIGATTARWRNIHAVTVLSASFQGNVAGSWLKTQYGAFGGATPNLYYLEVGVDSAGKPGSSTWTVSPSNAAAKDDVTPVDPVAALALVRRVPLVRYRYNGAYGSPAGMAAIGVIAENVADIMPDSIHHGSDGSLGWNAHELLMLNVAAVQALAARLERIERNQQL